MGKVKAWVMDMEEDAIDMAVEEWTDKHGESLIEVYHEARREHLRSSYHEDFRELSDKVVRGMELEEDVFRMPIEEWLKKHDKTLDDFMCEEDRKSAVYHAIRKREEINARMVLDIVGGKHE